jgi:ubiquinone/menaquinone biosynthesis C-methylase UbiE
MPFWHAIRYRHGDITATAYPDRRFRAITCLSVIEHGVPLDPFISEVKRLLQDGGVFVFTTDFAADGVDDAGLEDVRPFGLDWQIFNRDSLQDLVDRFLASGFSLLQPTTTSLEHSQRPITWKGREYTFALVALQTA